MTALTPDLIGTRLSKKMGNYNFLSSSHRLIPTTKRLSASSCSPTERQLVHLMNAAAVDREAKIDYGKELSRMTCLSSGMLRSLVSPMFYQHVMWSNRPLFDRCLAMYPSKAKLRILREIVEQWALRSLKRTGKTRRTLNGRDKRVVDSYINTVFRDGLIHEKLAKFMAVPSELRLLYLKRRPVVAFALYHRNDPNLPIWIERGSRMKLSRAVKEIKRHQKVAVQLASGLLKTPPGGTFSNSSGRMLRWRDGLGFREHAQLVYVRQCLKQSPDSQISVVIEHVCTDAFMATLKAEVCVAAQRRLDFFSQPDVALLVGKQQQRLFEEEALREMSDGLLKLRKRVNYPRNLVPSSNLRVVPFPRNPFTFFVSYMNLDSSKSKVESDLLRSRVSSNAITHWLSLSDAQRAAFSFVYPGDIRRRVVPFRSYARALTLFRSSAQRYTDSLLCGMREYANLPAEAQTEFSDTLQGEDISKQLFPLVK